MDNYRITNILVGKREMKDKTIKRVVEAEIQDVIEKEKFYICLVIVNDDIVASDTEYSVFHDLVMDDKGFDDGQVDAYLQDYGDCTKYRREKIMSAPSNPWSDLYRVLLRIAENGNESFARSLKGARMTQLSAQQEGL